MPTKIRRCTCKHEYQDKEHGKQKRVMNTCKGTDGGANSALRCTVCGEKYV